MSTVTAGPAGAYKGRIPQSVDFGKRCCRKSKSSVWLRIEGNAWIQLVCNDKSEFNSVQPTPPASGIASRAEHITLKAFPMTSVSGFRKRTLRPLECAKAALFAPAKPRFFLL